MTAMQTQTLDTTLQSTRALVRPESVDVEARTVEITWTTGARGKRYSWSIGEFFEELEVSESALRMERLNSGAPFLEVHNQGDLDSVLGVVERAWIEGDEGRALIRFSSREDVEPIFKDVKDGILRNISVGYIVHKYSLIEDGEDVTPVYRATDWEPTELSLVPIGFDDGAKVRSARDHERYQTIFEIRQAQKLDDHPAAAPETHEEDAMTEEEKRAAEESIRRETQEAERKRGLTIRQMAKKVGLGDDFADDLVERGVSVADASTAMIDKLAADQEAKQPATRSAHETRVTSDVDQAVITAKRGAMLNALLHRCDPATKLEDGAREFRGMQLIDMAREAVEMAGGNARGLSRQEVARAALGCDRQATRAAGMITSNDFPMLLGGAVNRTLRAGYEMAPQSWRVLGRQTTVPDFRAVTRVALGDIGPLSSVSESGEYSYGSLSEEGAPIKVAKFGKIIPISWEAVVNDDLGALTRVPQALGAAAAQTESNAVWDLLLGNPNFTDGTAIYHANHGNLAGTAGAINTATLAAARAAMRKQKSKGGEYLNLAPEFLVVGPDKESEAYQFTSSNYVPAKNSDINDVRNAALQVVVDARITGNQWYLFSAPGLVDTFEYAYLEGAPGVFTETREGFEVDGMEIKARLVFGAAWIDYRGVYKNAGA